MNSDKSDLLRMFSSRRLRVEDLCVMDGLEAAVGVDTIIHMVLGDRRLIGFGKRATSPCGDPITYAV